ncbi:MAG: DUF3999 family protein [Lentisphaeria bacterium]|jgi:hypothetical protein
MSQPPPPTRRPGRPRFRRLADPAWLAAAALFLLAPVATAALDPRLYPWQKEIRLELPPAPGQPVAVALDAEAYAATRELSDLRILDGRGGEIPYALEAAQESVTETLRLPCPVRVLAVADDPAGAGLTLTLELADPESRRPPPAGITIHTALRDYSRLVDVAGSFDGKEWRTLVEAEPVFESSRYQGFSKQDIPLPPPAGCRLFRLRIRNPDDVRESAFREVTRELRGGAAVAETVRTVTVDRAFTLDRVEFWSVQERAVAKRPVRRSWPPVAVTVTPAAKEQETILEVRTNREPLTAFHLRAATPQFIREVIVERPAAEGKGWVAVATGTLSRYTLKNKTTDSLAVHFPEQRHERWRLRIRNRDNPPLEGLGVTGEGPLQQLLFPASGGEDGSYRLLYGATKELPPPVYDFAAVLAQLRSRPEFVPCPALAGPAMANPAFDAAAEPAVPWHQRRAGKILIAAAVAAMVAALGLGVFRAMRGVESLG